MPSATPGATPSVYESESLILHYHHLLDYLFDHAMERPFNLQRISTATGIPLRTLVFLFETLHKSFRIFRLQHDSDLETLDREYDRITRDNSDPSPDTLYAYCLTSPEIATLCDLLRLIAIKPLSSTSLPAESQAVIDKCPALFVKDNANHISGSADAFHIMHEMLNCQKLNICLDEYRSEHFRITIQKEKESYNKK